MQIILAVHFGAALVAPWIFPRLGRRAFYLLAAVPAAAFVWLLFQHGAVYASPAGAPAEVVPWIPQLQLNLAFRMDALAWIMCLLVLGVGALVLAYCGRYFKDGDPGLGGFGAQLLAFAGAMFGLVTADDLILLFIFWELTTVLSYLLIGYARARIGARRAALQALLVTTFGGLTMLVGLIMLGQAGRTYRISELLAQAPHLFAAGSPTAGIVNVALLLILVGAISKSALVPFHFWLPGAMAAPTPVSAYLHAAAMVKAGIYLVARLAPGFSDTAYWQAMVLVLGLATMLIGGWRALREFDLKLILAYGTVSQLGFLTAVVGVGNRDAALAGLALLLAHGLFKATLFLVVGIIDHQTGTRDIRNLSGVFRSAPALGVVAGIGAASMAGVPLTAGFIAKESVYEALVHVAQERGPAGILVLAAGVAGSVLTFAYSARFLWGGFADKDKGMATVFKPVPGAFLFAPALLSVLTVVYGLWPVPVDSWIAGYASLFPAEGEVTHLALWHGLTPALGLTALTLAAGTALFLGRSTVTRLQDRSPSLGSAEAAYRGLVNAVDAAAIWVTGRTQRGSLYFYLSVILTTAIGANVLALFLGRVPLPDTVYWVDPGSPVQLVAAAVIIVGAVAAARANKRFLAVLMVSVTGYGIALIFALQGAPDLALTQMLVETIILVAFVLAMRRLPARLRERTVGSHRAVRLLIGAAFGLTMVCVALAAMGARTARPVSLDFPNLAYTGGGGLNIVNVTLVDIRAWDTFGEITVLASAATGVASLIFLRSRGDRLARAATVQSGSVGRRQEAGLRNDDGALATARRFATVNRDPWLVAGRTLAPERRSIIFEVITRLLFHSVIVFSIYLLLAGHNLPGGGFSGGLIAGLALTLRYLAGGRFELAEAARASAGLLLGGGLALAAVTGVAPLFLGGSVFQSAILTFWLPVFGDIKFVTSTLFDIGVYLVVVGLVLDVLRSLGAEIDEHEENNTSDEDEAELDDDSLEVARGR
ncbi:MAG: Na+/H+ antiporter subunit [Micrococcaceae bacterium]|nr:Na+/H+ antiporter subunit [Micrococcaceae bacterium]